MDVPLQWQVNPMSVLHSHNLVNIHLQVMPILVHPMFGMKRVWHDVHIAEHGADCRRSGLIRPVGEIQCAQDPDNVPPHSRLFMVVPKTAEGRAIEVGMTIASVLSSTTQVLCNQSDCTALEGCFTKCASEGRENLKVRFVPVSGLCRRRWPISGILSTARWISLPPRA